jgi:hypothetical protein
LRQDASTITRFSISVLRAAMGQTSQGVKSGLNKEMTRFAGNLGDKAGSASVVFPTVIVKWISKLRGMVIVLHALLSQ